MRVALWRFVGFVIATLGIIVGVAALAGAVGFGIALLISVVNLVALVWVLQLVSSIGMHRRPGSRFALSVSIFQPLDHPWIPMSFADAEAAWQTYLGSSDLTLQSGWSCRSCTMKRFAAEAAGGRICWLLVDLPNTTFAKWSAGIFVVFSKDATPSTRPAG